MVLYATAGPRRVRQVLGDLFVLGWSVLWIWVGTLTYAVVDAIAGPARRTARTAAELEGTLQGIGDRMTRVPALGDELAAPFRDLGAGVAEVTTQAQAQADLITTAAQVVGVATAAVPILVLLAVWLPGRIRFSREATAAQRFIDADPDLDLFALRAMASLPMTQLARVSDDPVGAWRRGDRAIVDELARLELARVGLSAPSDRQRLSAPGQRQGSLPPR